MSLTPGFLDELRTRLSLVQVVGRKVMWDTRKSNQGKGDMWAPCPFHQEKSASFHVDDRKGFYYCFGCHAKGDAISFVRETENVGFMEAVKILAGEAGMTVPQQDPKAQEKADYRTQLADIMEQCVQYFRLQLKTAAAVEARDYLTTRGFDEASLDRWDIGFTSDRGGAFEHLRGKGIDAKLIIDAGIAAESDRGGAPYDRFRGRIIFPIRDGRNRCIGFGGRAMAADARAKYLNSPETPLFDKGRSLYNHAPAREASGKGQPLIVAEGYMDVIALSEAGFGATVAPLGTAITEDQLRLLWRISPEPIIALDGDTAGLRAAMRLIDIALPLLEAGKSLRFAMMPDGQDPDDLIKLGGPQAMQDRLDTAIPMVHLLWQRETEGKDFDSPERKAGLDKALRDKIKLIADPSVRGHYGEEIKRLRWELFTPKRSNTARQFGKWQPKLAPMPSTKASILAGSADDGEVYLREAVILATLIATPAILPEFDASLERLRSTAPDHAALTNALLSYAGPPEGLRDALLSKLGPAPLEKLFSQSHVAIAPAIRRAGDSDIARTCVSEEFSKLAARRGHAREVADAVEDIAGLADESVTWRLTQAAQSIQPGGHDKQEDKTEYETGANGAKINKDERSALDQLLDQIKSSKAGK